MQQARAVLSSLLSEHQQRPVAPDEWKPVTAGASGRCLLRAGGVLGIYWTAQRADNNSFLPAAHGLRRAGIRVPQVLAERLLPEGCGACLVTDLGSRELTSLREASPGERKRAYAAVFRTLIPLYRLTPDWPLQPPFDASLYRWEQEYFAEHLLARHLGRDASAFLAAPALRDMAAWLASLPRVPVHRDCQAPNIMLHDGEAWLVDFQGMRMGLKEYDLASLLFDSHMPMTQQERDELLKLWHELGGQPIDPAVFAACALQRIMQALGAYANIGYNQGKPQYLKLISTALAALCDAAHLTPPDSPAYPVLPWLPVVV